MALLSTASHAAAPDAGAADAGLSCANSGDCAPPNPYCHPSRHVCVECIGDENCSSFGLRCDTDVGKCAICASDANCGPGAPYCDQKQGCVECITDANCGVPGVHCVDAKCGSCGDGVCGPKETIREAPQSSPFPFPIDNGRVYCPEECAKECPGLDLGSAVGLAVYSTDGEGLHDRLGDDTCGGVGSLDESMTWKAPEAGRYVLRTRAPGHDDYAAYLTLYESDCQSSVRACNTGTLAVDVQKGERLVFSMDGVGGSIHYDLDITRDDSGAPDGGPLSCSPARCPETDAGVPCCTSDGTGACGTQTEFGCRVGTAPPPPPVGDGGPVDPQLQQRCVQNAIQGTGPVCASAADCLCGACPRSVEDCRVIPDCPELLACMIEKGCSGVECNDAAQCGAIIGRAKGPSGAAFRTASDIQTCASVKTCKLDCPSSGADAGSDAGSCEGGVESACSCAGGGSGVQVCKDDGSGYGRCVCVGPDAGAEAGATKDKVTSSGGCDCGVARAPGEEHRQWPLLVGLAMGLVLRRRGRARQARQNKQTMGAPAGAG